MATIINNIDNNYPDSQSQGWVFYDVTPGTPAPFATINNTLETGGTLPLPTDPWTPAISSDQAGNNFYYGAEIDGRYDWREGLLIIPAAGPPGTPPVICRVHSPYATRAVEWTAERVGARPTVPQPNTGNAQEVPIARSVLVSTPAMQANGQIVTRASGRYVYALTITPGPTDTLANARAQFDGAGSGAYNMPSGDFVSGLIATVTYTGN